jgi:hypothetical protein
MPSARPRRIAISGNSLAAVKVRGPKVSLEAILAAVKVRGPKVSVEAILAKQGVEAFVKILLSLDWMSRHLYFQRLQVMRAHLARAVQDELAPSDLLSGRSTGLNIHNPIAIILHNKPNTVKQMKLDKYFLKRTQ